MRGDIAKPIDRESESARPVLERLQGNILKGHGRKHTALILISLDSKPETRAALRAFARKTVTSAWEQEQQSLRKHKTGGTELFGNLFLSVWGYLKLGYSWEVLRDAFLDKEGDDQFLNWFLQGMEHTGWSLADPPRTEWEPQYYERTDAMLLLACSELGKLDDAVEEVMAQIGGFGRVLGEERGRSFYRDGHAIEHFGFADGISQPRFFADDPEAVSPLTVLLPDALAGGEDAFGSFLVYRKLEQNVKAFRDAENRIADTLGLQGSDRERAGAMMMGRFRDGTPLTLSCTPLGQRQATNRFDFSRDQDGARCPFHAHIRKLNQRPTQRKPMARRGVPYGNYDPRNQGTTPPERDSGLLFLSFQRDIHVQFGAVQMHWANSVDFPKPGTGQDPIIGQGNVSTHPKWPVKWGDASAGTLECEVSRLVTLKGGEYFFAPSLAFFQKPGD